MVDTVLIGQLNLLQCSQKMHITGCIPNSNIHLFVSKMFSQNFCKTLSESPCWISSSYENPSCCTIIATPQSVSDKTNVERTGSEDTGRNKADADWASWGVQHVSQEKCENEKWVCCTTNYLSLYVCDLYRNNVPIVENLPPVSIWQVSEDVT